MKEIRLEMNMKVVSLEELTENELNLIEVAKEATSQAYAPYSKFHVGAAIALSNGEIVTGANQENVAYPSGMCAERVACYYAHAQYPEAKFEAIAIAAQGVDGAEVALPVSPCGSCRQAMLEYEKLAEGNIKVILVGAEDIYVVPSVKSLLPLAFTEF